MESVPALLQDQGMEDPLDSPEQLHDQLESLSFLCRFQYEGFSEYVCGLMDPILGTYTQALSAPGQLTARVVSSIDAITGYDLITSLQASPGWSAFMATKCFRLVHVADRRTSSKRGISCQNTKAALSWYQCVV